MCEMRFVTIYDDIFLIEAIGNFMFIDIKIDSSYKHTKNT